MKGDWQWNRRGHVSLVIKLLILMIVKMIRMEANLIGKNFNYIIDGHFSSLDIPFFMQHESYYCIIKRLPLDAILNNPFWHFCTLFYKIHINIVFLSTCRSPKCSLSSERNVYISLAPAFYLYICCFLYSSFLRVILFFRFSDLYYCCLCWFWVISSQGCEGWSLSDRRDAASWCSGCCTQGNPCNTLWPQQHREGLS